MNGTPDMRPPCHDGIIDSVRSFIERALPAHRSRDTPVVTLTYAQSIDGCIARADGHKLMLSNGDSQKLTHQVRGLHDAILVGINTVLSDDPQLNVRLVDGKDPQPVVVDSRLRIPRDARLMRDPCVRPLVATGETACRDKERQLLEAGARVIRLPLQKDGSIPLTQLLIRLRELGYRSVMIEGGAKIITSILVSQLADQFLLTVSPRFVGGMRAVELGGHPEHDGLPGLHNIDHQWLAGDLIIRADFQPEGVEVADCQVPQVLACSPSQTSPGLKKDDATGTA